MLKVVVVDRSSEIRRAFEHLLVKVPGVHIVGSAAEANVALDLADATSPDVLVLDVELDGGAYALLRRLVRRHPDTRVVALSNQDGADDLRRAFLRAGAAAFFDKAMEFEKARDWIAERARQADHA